MRAGTETDVCRDATWASSASRSRPNGAAIPLYRLVYFQIDRDARQNADIPPALRKPNVLSAIFRIGADNQAIGGPSSYALRLLVEPARTTHTAPAPHVRVSA